MKNTSMVDYDVIIVGGGISGLVCGCHLVKAGLKTIILEKNKNVGGYCTSFMRNGFNFDSCVCSLSGFGKDENLYKFTSKIELKNDLNLIRSEISDIILTKNYKVNFYYDINKTILELQKIFPRQKHEIKNFLELIRDSSVISLTRFRKFSFEQILDSYFTDQELKKIFSTPIFGYSGVSCSHISALVAFVIYKDFILSGGYYPRGGIQNFSNMLGEKFKELGGVLFTSSEVKQILIKDNKANGVILNNGSLFYSKYTVAACDYHEVFLKLVGEQYFSKERLEKIKNRDVSLSAFILYLGINKPFSELVDLKSHIWYIPEKNDNFGKDLRKTLNLNIEYIGITSSSLKNSAESSGKLKKETLFLITNVPFISKEFWNDDSKRILSDYLIKTAERVIPGLSTFIDTKVIATPLTLLKWTSNYNGSAYGWANTVEQFGDPDFSEKTEINNLLLTGHWLNNGSGVNAVSNTSFRTAKLIIRKLTKKN